MVVTEKCICGNDACITRGRYECAICFAVLCRDCTIQKSKELGTYLNIECLQPKTYDQYNAWKEFCKNTDYCPECSKFKRLAKEINGLAESLIICKIDF